MKWVLYTITIVVIYLLGSCLPVLLPGPVKILWLAVLTFFVLQGSFRVNKLVLAFVYLIIASLILNLERLSIFGGHTERFIGFVLILASLGPLFNSEKMYEYKKEMFGYMFKILTIIVVISFVCYKLPMFNGESGFTGAFNQSMLNGPVAALCALFNLSIALNASKRWNKYLHIVLFIVCLLVSIMAASRGAIGALLVAVLFMLYFTYKNHITKLLRLLVVAFAIICVSVPLWSPYVLNLIAKQEVREARGDIASGRLDMWEDRIEDFKISPIYGVGFTNVKNISNTKVDLETGVIEPGSGWVYTLGTLGALGVLFVVLLLFRGGLLLQLGSVDYVLYYTMALFFAIHSIIEGYIFGAGGMMCWVMWYVIGLKENAIYLNKHNLLK